MGNQRGGRGVSKGRSRKKEVKYENRTRGKMVLRVFEA